MLGKGFRHVEKAQRKVRTMAGVKFFDAPIGTPITPGMVKEARSKHGDKKTDTMLVSQQRNTRRDARRAFFGNQADVRHKKREQRVERNAAARAAKRGDEADRRLEQMYSPTMSPVPAQAKAAERAGKVTSTTAPPTPTQAKAQATHTKVDSMIDLLHKGSWTEEDIGAAITLVMEHRAVGDSMVRGIVQELVKRIRAEEK